MEKIMKDQPYKISIISPNYNCEKFIEETITSVLNQTYSNWELLIVDDFSTDLSYSIALLYSKKDSRIKVFRNERNLGAAYSRNIALNVASGDYIAFLDSDDLWEPNKLERQIEFMKKNDCDFSFSRYDLIDENDIGLYKCARIIKRLTYRKYLHHCFTGCLTVMYDRRKFETIRSFNVKNNNDYGLFLQIVRQAENAMGMDECLAHYRIRNNSISRNKMKKIKPYFILMHGFLHMPYFVVCWYLFTNIIIGKIWKYQKM